MFSVGFGSQNREVRIRQVAEDDPTTAVILAAVHFEWMLKRTILKLGLTPTKTLRDQLADVYTIKDKKGHNEDYKTIWRREVEPRFKNAALGTVLGRLTAIQNVAWQCRGHIVHGNGTASREQSQEAVELFLEAGEKLRAFATKHKVNLDSRLTPRATARKIS